MGKDYRSFKVSHFIEDEFFWLWVTEPTPEAEKFWQNFLISNPGKKQDVEEASNIIIKLNKATFDLPEKMIENTWDDIGNKIAEKQSFSYIQEEKTIPLRSNFWKQWGKAAAIFIGVLFSAMLIIQIKNNSLARIETNFNETKSITLPDNSKIILNANSTVSYKKEWNKEEVREIWLNGEGFFDVQHLENHQKFLVHVNDVEVEVVGTMFNVNSRRGETKVVLKEGKVNFKVKEEKGIAMLPGELIAFSQEKRIVKKKVDPEVYSSWTRNKFVFDGTSLHEIIYILEDYYGYQVQVEDKAVLKLLFTGTVSTDNPNLLLEGLREVHDLTITKSGENVLIKKQ